MKRISLINREIALLIIILSAMFACASKRGALNSKPTEKNWYGADLTSFPPYARTYIMNEAATKEKMEKQFMNNPRLKVWWGNDNNSILIEVSYTIAEGFVGAGKMDKYEWVAYRGSSQIYSMYGQYAKYHTLRFEWENKKHADALLKKDPYYAEVIKFAQQLCKEIEYDWANYKGYKGAPAKPSPNLKHFVCAGYANEVTEKALGLKCVKAVQEWSSSGHAWNVLTLIDGRTLYLDLTWFDNEHINEKTGEIYQKDDYDYRNITFDEELFKYSNVGYGSQIFHHTLGKVTKTRTKE